MLERMEAKTKDGLERIDDIVRYRDEYKVETTEKKGDGLRRNGIGDKKILRKTVDCEIEVY
jgi:hypothetical protein